MIPAILVFVQECQLQMQEPSRAHFLNGSLPSIVITTNTISAVQQHCTTTTTTVNTITMATTTSITTAVLVSN